MLKKVMSLLLLISLSFLGSINAQEKLEPPTDAFGKTVMQCLKANGIDAQYKRATNQLFVMLKQQFANKNVPNSVWEDLETIKPTALENIKIRMIQAYKVHFNEEDVNQMLSFYVSDEGEKMLTNGNNLTDEERKVIKDFFHTTTGQKMMESQASLTKMIGEISETWSSELYQKQIEKLAERGFSL